MKTKIFKLALAIMLANFIPVKTIVFTQQNVNTQKNETMLKALAFVLAASVIYKQYNKFYGSLDSQKTNTKNDHTSQNKQKPNQNFGEIAGQLPQEIKEVIQFLDNSDEYNKIGAVMPRGILLEGPPGTGKTSIARAIAHEANAEFFNASATQFIEIYGGTGPKRIRELFDQARQSVKNQNKKAIIFIDEIDSIGTDRSLESSSEYKNTLNELLNQMDGFIQNDSLIVIAATNFAKSLDPALKRPGRFDRIIKLDLPNLKNRLAILQFYVNKIKHQKNINLNGIAKQTNGFSGAELKNLVNESAILAVRENKKLVLQRHLIKALKNIQKTRK